MFNSIKNLSILAMCLGAAVNAAAVPSVSADVMAALGLTESDLIQAQSAPESAFVEARAMLESRQATCRAPTTPANSTYGACVLPLVEQARQGNAIYMLVIGEYLTKTMGCPADGIRGAAARPVGEIHASRCTHPGNERVTAGAPGWSVNTSFNAPGCPPGFKCA